jgi:hypothetical protein
MDVTGLQQSTDAGEVRMPPSPDEDQVVRLHHIANKHHVTQHHKDDIAISGVVWNIAFMRGAVVPPVSDHLRGPPTE